MSSAEARSLKLVALPGFPMVEPGDDLAALILEGVERAGERLVDDDILVVAQKVVSKSEDRYIDLDDVTPSQHAATLAREVDKDPRLVEVILSEAREVVRYRTGVLVVEHKLGLVLANAGIDQSNIEHGEKQRVLLLPEDPDGSASRLRRTLQQRVGVEVGILISDSLGRAWRLGTVGVALGVAGVEGLSDLRGCDDLFGRELRVTEVGLGDEIAAAASLLQGQAGEGRPVVLVRGLHRNDPDGSAAALIRPKSLDLFR